jgi:RimJ/RimL family protein N-acetyltransferase
MKYVLNGHESDRLKYRLLRRDDFATWLNLFRDTEVAGFLGFGKIPTPELQCEEWFKIQEKRYANDLGGMNVLIEKETGRFVGQCGLLVQEVENKKELEIGYSILKEFRNRGFAGEAAKKCRDFAFENNFAESLISIVHVNNISSEKVALKNGMTSSKRTFYKEMPVNIFRIFKDDWLKLR